MQIFFAEDYHFLRKVLGCETVISDIQFLGRKKDENKEENEKENSETYRKPSGTLHERIYLFYLFIRQPIKYILKTTHKKYILLKVKHLIILLLHEEEFLDVLQWDTTG